MGYGIDIALEVDITRDLATTARPSQTLAEAIVRRLSGTLFHDPNYGYDLIQAIGAGFQGAISSTIIQRTAVEVEKEERVRAAVVTDTSQGSDDIRMGIRVIPEAGPLFDLTLTIDRVAGVISAEEIIPVRTAFNGGPA